MQPSLILSPLPRPCPSPLLVSPYEATRTQDLLPDNKILCPCPKPQLCSRLVSFHSIQRLNVNARMNPWKPHSSHNQKPAHTPSPKLQTLHHSHRYPQQSMPVLRSQHEGGKALSDSKSDEGFISSSTSGAGELWSKAGYPSAAVRVTDSTTVESVCSHTHPCRSTLCLGIGSHPQHAV